MNKALRNVSVVKNAGKKLKTSVIILAAGEAARMRSHGPRPLIRIYNNTNLISHQVDIINTALPNNEIILVCGCDADKVMNSAPTGIIKVHNENYENTNIVRSMALGLRAATTDRALFIYGDLVFNLETIDNAKLETSSIFVESPSVNLFNKDSVGCTIVNDKIEHMLYNLEHRWVEIMFLTGKELSMFKTVVWNRDKDKLFGFEAVNEILARNANIAAQSPKNMKIIDIDSSKDLNNIKNIIQ